MAQYEIDLDALSRVDDRRGWTKTPTMWRTGGLITWERERMFPYFPVLPRSYGSPSRYRNLNRPGYAYKDGEQILHDIRDLPVLNANPLDFLLEHPQEMPSWCTQEWFETNLLYFWGTHYIEQYRGDRFVRGLRKEGSRLVSCDMLLDGEGWGKNHAVAMYLGLPQEDAS
jgi:hypothetical protein